MKLSDYDKKRLIISIIALGYLLIVGSYILFIKILSENHTEDLTEDEMLKDFNLHLNDTEPYYQLYINGKRAYTDFPQFINTSDNVYFATCAAKDMDTGKCLYIRYSGFFNLSRFSNITYINITKKFDL